MASVTGSLVSNILQKSSALDENVIDESLQKLEKKTVTLKGQLCELIKADYINFESYVESAVSLEQKLQEVTLEYRKVSSRIEQELKNRLLKSADKREELKTRLQEIEAKIIFLEGLVSVYQDLESAKAEIKSEKFVSASERLNGALIRVESIKCEAKVCRALVFELTKELGNLNLKLQEEWNRVFLWSPRHVPEKPATVDVAQTFQLKIHIKPSTTISHLDEVVSAMKLLDETQLWQRTVQMFGQKLLAALLRPAILHPELRVTKVQQDGCITLGFERSSDAPDPAKMYKHLETILAIVKLAVPEDHRSGWVQDLGNQVFIELSDLIIKHHLSTSIPKDLAQMEGYSRVIEKTQEFEKALVALGFIGESCTTLSQYASNVSTHVAAQKCQDLLVRARSILMKTIHDTVIVEPQEVEERLAPLCCVAPNNAMTVKDEDTSCRGVLEGLTFQFPTCTVSKCVLEFHDLLNQKLYECTETTTFSAATQILYSTRMMVELFCAVPACYHKAAITEIPRAAAVYYNNCMYIAHHLFALGYLFYSRLPEQVNALRTTFVDQAILVRQLGQDAFAAELRKQSAVIMDTLKAVSSFSNVSDPGVAMLVDRSIQQALLQIRQLSKVYYEVLPANVYCKSVGTLMNVLTTHVVTATLRLEDISTDDCSELSRIADFVIKNGPDALLGEGNTFSSKQVCPTWNKLEQLAMLLNYKLQEIVTAWDSGNGPLAKEFSAPEVRGLIKALFQNTDKRAAALAKIGL